MYKVILTITLILLLIGFAPYKFPRGIDSISDNEILVDHSESTCTSDLYIVSGKLNIPQDIKSYFTNEPKDFNIDSTGLSMFDTNPGNYFLVFENQFIISGKVVGVDTSEYKYCETNYPIFKIDKWAPTNYSANFWSFNKPVFILYFSALFALILTSIVLVFIRRPWKSKK